MHRGFNQQTRRTNAQRFMVSGYRLGYTNSQIHELLTSVGIGYRTSLFHSDMADIRASNPVLPRLTKQGKAIIANNAVNFPMLTKGIRRFQYYYSVQTRDPVTGRFGIRTEFSFTTPLKLPKSVTDVLAKSIPLSGASDVGTADYSTLSAPTVIEWKPID